MELSEMQARVTELEQRISNLPAGSITKKTVNGKEYFYHRWTEDKKRREKYIPADELENFRAQIERRKELEQELKALKKQLPKAKSANHSAFATNVRTGEALRSFAASVCGYRRRECFQQLHNFVYGEPQDKVFILYGLRRTGKTTMIRQIFAEMSDTQLAKAAFIQIAAKDTLADVNRDLKALEAQGFRYVFLDEVTLMEDFIEGAALFSDVFAACGIKIVLSGTDSLGFLFKIQEERYKDEKINFNGQLKSSLIDKFCPLTDTYYRFPADGHTGNTDRPHFPCTDLHKKKYSGLYNSHEDHVPAIPSD